MATKPPRKPRTKIKLPSSAEQPGNTSVGSIDRRKWLNEEEIMMALIDEVDAANKAKPRSR